MTRAAHFQPVVDALLEKGKPLPKKYLPLFSDMDPASLDLLLETWPRIALTTKRILLDELDTLLDEDTIVSFDDFAHALLKDPDAPVRSGAIRLLAECTDTRLLHTYERLALKDPNAEVRAEAARVLGLFVELGELDEISESSQRRVEETLLAATRDEDANVRRHALESLGFSSREDVPPLIEAAYERQDPDWIVSALVAMGHSNDDRWSEPVVRMILDDHREARLAAVRAAGELSLPAARLPLLHLLDEEDDSSVFSAAIWSLSQIGGEDVRDYLQSLLDQTDGDDEIEFIEDALANLSFTEDLARFDLLALDPEEDLLEMEEWEEDEEEVVPVSKPEPAKPSKSSKSSKTNQKPAKKKK